MVQATLQFIKTHLIVILCGVAGLAFISFAVLGMMSDRIKEEMSQRVSNARRMDSLKSNAKNEKMIAAEKRRGELFNREYEETLEEAYRINRHEPLIDGVFPKPTSQTMPFRFVERYDVELRKLPSTLGGGSRPTEAEIESERLELVEAAREKTEGVDQDEDTALTTHRGSSARTGGGPRPMTGSRDDLNPRGGLMPGGLNPPGLAPPRPGGSTRRPPRTGTTAADLKESPEHQAAISKAREIRMYVDPGAFQTAGVRGAEVAPSVDDLWYAQMSLWIEQDVVEALAQLQERFAQQAPDGQANVMHLPVKRLESLRINHYRLEDQNLPFPSESGGGGLRPGGIRPSTIGGSGSESFTQRTSDAEFDVITFTLVVWVDQREILKVIDALTKENFYQCYDLDYRVVPLEEIDPMYVLGPAPIVRATFEFEGYFARAIYKEWMPTEVATALGISEDG